MLPPTLPVSFADSSQKLLPPLRGPPPRALGPFAALGRNNSCEKRKFLSRAARPRFTHEHQFTTAKPSRGRRDGSRLNYASLAEGGGKTAGFDGRS